ncbi:hypothetical protein F8R15_19105 [Thioclava sp. JE_KL1]|uniref:Uncharacterized protein n=1 Tax=Thioclava electrotropha TaxID=1549850 RepID=A0ABX6YZM3_9RHOB|nr:hypothetical protein [Thioclava electrotropha]MPQ95914.1 hypothetical protein [Thioclava sp. JE_KL1]QPZ93220.1 hypothetical protein AKL02_012305 [Thioclava electrotropha]
MSAQILAAVILLPFLFVALYAGIHEFLRFRSEGRANYGLIFDEETGTSYVTGIAEEEDAFDPDDFDPNDYNDPEVAGEPDESKT